MAFDGTHITSYHIIGQQPPTLAAQAAAAALDDGRAEAQARQARVHAVPALQGSTAATGTGTGTAKRSCWLPLWKGGGPRPAG
jgi:hypothetical protein